MRYAAAEADPILNQKSISNRSTGPHLVQKIIFCKFHRIRLDRLFYIIILRPQPRNSIIMELTMSGTHNDKWTDQDQNDRCSQLSYPV